ncbi:MAG: hypothetical protein ACXWCZ_10165 [Flavisolibacter sp.]
MGEILLFNESRNQRSHFKIDYPYYGLFGSADITPISGENDVVYKCELLNGSIIFLKKLIQPKKWVDANLNSETPLSVVIGRYIDDFLKVS